MDGRGVRRVIAVLLGRGPVWAVVGICCALPLGWLVWQIIANPVVLSELRLDAFRLKLIGRTISYNVAAGVLAVVMAFPAAVVLGRGRKWPARVLWFVLPVSLLMPSIAYAYGWSQFLWLMAEPIGWLIAGVLPWTGVEFWNWIGILYVPGTHPPSSLFEALWRALAATADVILRRDPVSGGPRGVLDVAGSADVGRCVWSLATWLWPLPAVVMGLALRRMETHVQEQALLDGALWRVTFRQLLGPAVAAGAVVSLLAMQEYAVYEPTGISVVATEVRMVFDTGAFGSAENPITAPISPGGSGLMGQGARVGAAVATGLPVLGLIAVLAVVAGLLVRGLGSAEGVTVGAVPRVLRARWWWMLAAGGMVLVAVAVPTVSLVWSMRRELDLVRMWNAVAPQASGSVMIAGLTGLVAVGLALWATLHRQRWTVWVAAGTFLVGGQILAISMIHLYNRPWLEWFYDTPGMMVSAYLGRFGWIALFAAVVTWSNPWREVREMASVDGADPWRTGWHVVWPLCWPICAAAGVLLMVLALTEVPATVLLSPQRPPMLVPLLMTWVHMLRNDDMLEGSLLLMSMVLVLSAAGVGLIGVGVRFLRAMDGAKREDTKNQRPDTK